MNLSDKACLKATSNIEQSRLLLLHNLSQRQYSAPRASFLDIPGLSFSQFSNVGCPF